MRNTLKRRKDFTFGCKKKIFSVLILSLMFISIAFAYINTTLGVSGNVKFDEKVKDKALYIILSKKLKSYKDNVSSEFVTNSTGINFDTISSNTNGKGLYLRAGTENDAYPIYYFRGGSDANSDGIEDYLNNNVLFGGFCWKIVRTTEKGGVKLVYNGVSNTSNAKGKCANTGTSSQISTTSAFNTNITALSDVGYMYGTRYAYTTWTDTAYVYGSDVKYSNGVYTLTNTSTSNKMVNIKTKHYTCKLTTNGTCSTVYYVYSLYSGTAYAISLTGGKKLENIISESFTNTTNSPIKGVIDNWFKENLLSQESKLEDAVWCNDRSIALGGYSKNGDSTIFTFFGAYGTRGIFSTSTKPAVKDELACPNKGDRFTKNDTTVGNGALTYPVGLLTADEATLVGNVKSGNGKTTYLYTGQYQWTMTPYIAASLGFYSDGLHINANGNLNGDSEAYSYGIRPSVVLKAGTVISGGTGTLSDPYVIS